jgi:hypothetical protein
LQAVSTRFMLLIMLMVCWSCECLHPGVVVALAGVAYMLTCSRGSCSELLLSGILPGYSCKEGGRVEDGLLL